MKKTIECLAKAFIGESQARNRYDMYAKIAKKEGYERIAEIFSITSMNEREHATKLMNHLLEFKKDIDIGKIKVEAEAVVQVGTTIENLKSAIAGENYEHTQMYPEFAEIAKKEGFDKISQRLLAISHAEEHHEERYAKILEQLEKGTFFKKQEKTYWVCKECGYVHYGTAPPDVCPSCDHSKAYYELKCEEF